MQAQPELMRQHEAYKAVRERLFRRPVGVTEETVRSPAVTLDAIDKKNMAVVQSLNNNISALKRRVSSLEEQSASKDYVINKLQLDLADAQARILAQAEMLSKIDVSGDPEIAPAEPKKPVSEIIAEVLRDFPDVTWADIQGIRRTRHLVRPRQICAYEVYKQRPDLSLPTIGRLFGGRDHTTILHSVHKIKAERERERA